MVGGLLILSAALRTGAGLDEVVVLAANAATDAVADEGGAPGDHGGSSATHPAEAQKEAGALLEALREREARIEKRERGILIRMQALKVAESEIDEKLVALEEAENRLKETLDIARSAAEKDLTQLTDVYARMKPRQASALFEEMDPNFAAGFLGRMPPEAAAAIMAGLPPDKAYTISVMLAGRNADVPKE